MKYDMHVYRGNSEKVTSTLRVENCINFSFYSTGPRKEPINSTRGFAMNLTDSTSLNMSDVSMDLITAPTKEVSTPCMNIQVY